MCLWWIAAPEWQFPLILNSSRKLDLRAPVIHCSAAYADYLLG